VAALRGGSRKWRARRRHRRGAQGRMESRASSVARPSEVEASAACRASSTSVTAAARTPLPGFSPSPILFISEERRKWGTGWESNVARALHDAKCEQGIATAGMGDEGRGPCLLAGPGLRRRLHLETLSESEHGRQHRSGGVGMGVVLSFFFPKKVKKNVARGNRTERTGAEGRGAVLWSVFEASHRMILVETNLCVYFLGYTVARGS